MGFVYLYLSVSLGSGGLSAGTDKKEEEKLSAPSVDMETDDPPPPNDTVETDPANDAETSRAEEGGALSVPAGGAGGGNEDGEDGKKPPAPNSLPASVAFFDLFG